MSVPGQGEVASYGFPSTPTVYCSEDWDNMTYYFQDQNPSNPALTLLSHRHISATASCVQYEVIAGGTGYETNVTYLEGNNQPTTLDAVRVGPGATTFISVLNSTCGARCTEIYALQSANNNTIPHPAFFKCNSTITPVSGIEEYTHTRKDASPYQLADDQARIMAGAIGWTGFNFSKDDQLQYVRYSLDSWWSPNEPTTAEITATHIMEYSIEAIAAFDYNGPRHVVKGWYPQTAQTVNVLWRWAGAILGVIPFLQLLVCLCVIRYANKAIIRDASCMSTARLLRPLVERLGPNGCLLTGKEIAEEFPDLRLRYGYRDPPSDLQFRNEIGGDIIRHVDLIDEQEGLGPQGAMPPGRYDGLSVEQETVARRKVSRTDNTKVLDDQRRRIRQRLGKLRAVQLKPD